MQEKKGTGFLKKIFKSKKKGQCCTMSKKNCVCHENSMILEKTEIPKTNYAVL